jgi:hypothetical protein
MPYKEEQPRLMASLSWIPLKQVLNKNLFGGRWLTQYNFFVALSFQYESGALIGRAKSDKLSILEKILGNPTVEGELVQTCKDAAKKRLDEFRRDVGKEPDTFGEFILDRELERSGLRRLLDDAVLSIATHLQNRTRREKALKAFLKKVPFEKAYPYLHIFGMEGVGFGSSFPELTEIMCKNHYEKKIDIDAWSKMRAAGLDIPEKPDVISLEEREKSLITIVAAYTAEFYPELLDPLDLRGYLVDERDEKQRTI